MRTAKSCGSGAAVLALSPGEAKLLAGDGGKRAVLREEHEVSCKAIAQGRPECSSCPVCSCALLFAQIARETAGAASTRSSLRPPSSGGTNEDAKPRAINAARSRSRMRMMGRAKRNPSRTNTGTDRYRFAPPILRDGMTRQDGHRAAVLKGEATGRTVACHAPGTRPRGPVTARPASIYGIGISLW